LQLVHLPGEVLVRGLALLLLLVALLFTCFAPPFLFLPLGTFSLLVTAPTVRLVPMMHLILSFFPAAHLAASLIPVTALAIFDRRAVNIP
jgi:hypothetical protein